MWSGDETKIHMVNSTITIIFPFFLVRNVEISTCHPFQVVDGLKEELSVVQTKLNRLQHEADAKVLARAANNEGGRQGGGAGGVANKAPTSLEVKVPPVEQRSSGEVYILSLQYSIFYSNIFLQGMDQSELDSSFPPTPVSLYLHCMCIM